MLAWRSHQMRPLAERPPARRPPGGACALTANSSSVDFNEGGAARPTARAFIQTLVLHEGPAVLPSTGITELGVRIGHDRVRGSLWPMHERGEAAPVPSPPAIGFPTGFAPRPRRSVLDLSRVRARRFWASTHPRMRNRSNAGHCVSSHHSHRRRGGARSASRVL